MEKDRERLRYGASALIAVLTAVGAYICFAKPGEDGILVAYGAENLKFFTVESNLFLGLVCLADLVLAVLGKTGRLRRRPPVMETLFYIASVAVALTFTVVVLFFGPGVGYAPLFRDANLYFPLIVPVLGMLSFCLFHRGRAIPLGETVLALIPSAAYGLYYTAVLLARGVHFPETDWYGFAAGGLRGSVLTAGGVLLTTWLLALLLRLAAGGAKHRGNRPEETKR